MFCGYCGKKIPDEALFCPECGSRVVSVAVQEPVEPVVEETVINEPVIEDAMAGDSASPVNNDPIAPAFVPVPPANDEPLPPAYDPGTPVYNPVPPAVNTEKPRKKKTWLWIVIGAAAAILIAAGVIFALRFSQLKKSYEQANDLYAQGKYQEAAEAYEQLGNYQDSAEAGERAKLWVDAQALEKNAGSSALAWAEAASTYEKISGEQKAADAAAKCLNMSVYCHANDIVEASPEDPEALAEAISIYEQCGGVEDSAERIAECEHEIAYLKALDLMDSGDLDGAVAAFADLDGYKDSDWLLQECTNEKVYLEAKALMADKKWDEASTKLISIAGYQDADMLENECSTWLIYNDAEEMLAAGWNYDAYCSFASIEYKTYDGLPDIEERMAACVVPYPATGETYHNPDYSNNTVRLTIDNTGFMNTFVKLYMGDTLISSVFIPENGESTFWLPAGTYSMNKGYGDLWFGPYDMFGDEGYYWKCDFGGSDTFTLEANYAYIISSGGEGTNINNHATGRDQM